MAISGVFVLPDRSRFSWTSQHRHGNCRKINIRAANTDYSPPLVYIIDNTDSGSHLGGGGHASCTFLWQWRAVLQCQVVQPSLTGLLGTDAESAELSHATLLHLPKWGKEKQKHSTDEIQLPQKVLHKDSELQDSAKSFALEEPSGQAGTPPVNTSQGASRMPSPVCFLQGKNRSFSLKCGSHFRLNQLHYWENTL